jgi:hypothetical protein
MDGRSYGSGKSVTANDVEDENYQPQVFSLLASSICLGALKLYLLNCAFIFPELS